jgi:predicted HicB family RNase H-like nuclease
MKKDFLEYKGFVGTVHFSTEDEVFFGKIEGIPDLVSFEGNSVKELKKAFEEAVNSYIKTCHEHNKPVVKSLKGSFNIRINPELHRRAYNISLARGISLNQFVQKAIERELTE